MASRKKPLFNLKLDEIKKNEKEEQKKQIMNIKAPYLNDFQKLLLLLSEEKTTTICQIKSYMDELEKRDINKLENCIQDKTININDTNFSGKKSYQVLEKEKAISYTANGNNESNIKENDIQNSNFNEREGLSKEGDSSDKEYELENDGFETIQEEKKNKYKKNFYIDIETINENYEKLILKRMEKYNNLNISELEKRILALREDKTTTIYIKSTVKHDNSNININVKSENNLKDDHKNTNEENENIIIYKPSYSNNDNNDKSNISLNKTNDITNNDDINNSTINENENSENKKNKFNPVRVKYFLKNKIYDIPINLQKEKVKTPTKYWINDKDFGFVYDNNLKTFYITGSEFILNYENDNKIINNNIKCDNELGLYFCGKNIEIKNKDGIITKQKCSPDNFMCKECMKINKNNYQIKDNYLININGRVVKKNKGKYHCFGHFLCNNQIEDCIVKFSCKACKLLEEYPEYYNKDK